MNLPFLRYFKKGREMEESNLAVAPPPTAPLEKPASERFGKTVMPNASRVVGVDPIQDFSLVPPIGNPPPAMSSEPVKLSLGEEGAVKAIRPRSLASNETPAAERTIALRLADLVPHLPEGVLQDAEADPEQRVLLKAAEVERGMASGRPTVSLRSIYQQAPAAFAVEVGEEDEREVALPFGKVLEQFTAFQVRADQVIGRDVPQLETPFLKMTQADSERLGTPAAPVPPPRSSVSFAAELLDPDAVAATVPVVTPPVAAAEPPAPKAIRPLRLPLPNESARPPVPPAPAPTAPPTIHPAVPARAPLSLQPTISSNGTGGPAPERVPASSGSPVPTRLPSPFAPPPAALPVQLPFKGAPPSTGLRPASPPDTVAPVLKAKGSAPVAGGACLRLPLQSVLRDISPFQLSTPTDAIPATAELEIPFSIVQPQLSLGRITISPAQFEAGLPEEYRALLKLEDAEVPVSLPLQEVLANLPNESLQLRADQEVPELGDMFETPFSAKATEDAARLKQSATKPADLSGKTTAKDDAVVADPGRASSAGDNKARDIAQPGSATPATTTPPERTRLQAAFDTDEALDAKAVVALASKLPGVSACAIVFSDGLSLAGNIPAESGAEGLCALAPSLMRRVEEQISGTQLGALTGLTLFCARTPVSFFTHGDICLATLHSAGDIPADIRTRLQTAVQELARIYAPSA